MTNYHVVREFETGITRDELNEAVERSRAAIEEMREDGEVISYLGSDVFTGEDGTIEMTVCAYDAESLDVVAEQSELAELPVRSILQLTDPVFGVAPRAGVVAKAA